MKITSKQFTYFIVILIGGVFVYTLFSAKAQADVNTIAGSTTNPGQAPNVQDVPTNWGDVAWKALDRLLFGWL